MPTVGGFPSHGLSYNQFPHYWDNSAYRRLLVHGRTLFSHKRINTTQDNRIKSIWLSKKNLTTQKLILRKPAIRNRKIYKPSLTNFLKMFKYGFTYLFVCLFTSMVSWDAFKPFQHGQVTHMPCKVYRSSKFREIQGGEIIHLVTFLFEGETPLFSYSKISVCTAVITEVESGVSDSLYPRENVSYWGPRGKSDTCKAINFHGDTKEKFSDLPWFFSLQSIIMGTPWLKEWTKWKKKSHL